MSTEPKLTLLEMSELLKARGIETKNFRDHEVADAAYRAGYEAAQSTAGAAGGREVACQAECVEHVGEVQRVRVVGPNGTQHGDYSYCESAIADDRKNGLTVDAVEGDQSDEDAYVIQQLGRLLAEIAVIVKGPEPAGTLWSYHDLPDMVRALKAPASPPVEGQSILAASERAVIETLLGLAYAAWCVADSSEDAGEEGVSIEHGDFGSLCAHLDELEKLPDDQPGYTMGEAAKARWALRRLLVATPPEGQSVEQRAGVTLPHDIVDEVRKALRSSANCARAYHVEQSSKVALANLEDAIATAALSAQAPSEAVAGFHAACDLFRIGSASRSVSVLMANLANVKRFAEYLHAIESEFFMVPGQPDDYYPDDEPEPECLVNSWGSTREQYVEQFRAALAKLYTGPQARGVDESAAERLCRIYFEIASEAVGEDVVRTERDKRIALIASASGVKS